jgi:hypothetical protein
MGRSFYWLTFGSDSADCRDDDSCTDVDAPNVSVRRFSDHRAVLPDMDFILNPTDEEAGRREGWLDVRTGPGVTAEEASRVNQVSLKLSQASGNQPCDRIWDGS